MRDVGSFALKFWHFVEATLSVGMLVFLSVLWAIGGIFRIPILDFTKPENIAMVSIMGTLGLCGLTDMLLRFYLTHRNRVVRSLRGPDEIADALSSCLREVSKEILSTHLAALPLPRDSDSILTKVETSCTRNAPIRLERIVAIQTAADLQVATNTLQLREEYENADVVVRTIANIGAHEAGHQSLAVVNLIIFDRESAILAFPSRNAGTSTGLLVSDIEAVERVVMKYWLRLQDDIVSQVATVASLRAIAAQLGAPD